MFNKADILIDVLKEYKDLSSQENISLDEKIKLTKVMLEATRDIKFQLEHRIKNLEERKSILDSI